MTNFARDHVSVGHVRGGGLLLRSVLVVSAVNMGVAGGRGGGVARYAE